ncbi:enoyl-CoA delta isomerase 1, mitochondrial [Plutella xylostella]|uniref:enoyl-CoA delta isomerase 1, mitochondrial n=1 Tax=Plutella xylostella TaxID=51655 RepID=UPI00203227D3|nr:enoyl-CoA delta isomerase 1, mitochondrial [Plutella xylostella]
MFTLRQVGCNARSILGSIRQMSASAGPLVDVAVDNAGVATVTMQRLPVNSLNLDLLTEMNKTLDDLAKNKTRGMILTSASPTVFSAGLDIMEMYNPDFKRAETFWNTLQDVWLKLFGSGYPTAAAINGHAPAGGCLLALSCEYRVMATGKFTIGLNETALGIVAPTWFIDSMCNTISSREAEFALTTGRMFSVDEALKTGLIDETAADKAGTIEKCRGFIKKFERISPMARAATKQKIREIPLRKLMQNRQKDTEEFLNYLKNPMVQKGLEMYIASLKQKAKK